jgi:hypothetical protein
MAVEDNVVIDGDGEDILDDKYFEDLLENDAEEVPVKPQAEEKPKLTEEQLRKNKNAEEARKRREAEAKAAKTEAVETTEEAKKPAETEEQPASEEAAPDPKVEQVNKLGEQLVQFKQKYPDVDLAQLDGDKAFKRFIDGRVLGKKDFTTLYEEYQEFRSEMGLTVQQQNNQIKSQASTGSPTSSATSGADVFSQDEMRRISERLPFMSPREAAKIEQKLKRSIQYYDNN